MTKVTLALQDKAGNLSAPTVITINRQGSYPRYDGASLAHGSDGTAAGNKLITDLETLIGGPLGCYRSYFADTDTPADLASIASRDLGFGRLPILSTKVPDGDWSAVASGAKDSWLIPRLDAIHKVSGPKVFILNHEPENDVNGETRTSVTFRKMYEHVFPIVDKNYPEITLTACHLGGSFNDNVAGGAKNSFKDWLLTRGVSCHMTAFDEYNQGSPPQFGKWLSPEQLHGNIIDKIHNIDPGMPIGICEYGCRIDPAQPGRAAQWFSDFYTMADTRLVVWTSQFHSFENSKNGTWEFKPNDEQWTPFKKAILASRHVAKTA